MRFLFGDYALDSATRELTRKGEVRPVSPKVFQLLEMLLRRRPEALSKSEIYEGLWPQTFVSESSLTRLTAEAREALGDDARQPRFLRTVYGFGYAFCGEVLEERRPRRMGLACVLILGAREVPLSSGENILGRSDDAVVRIDSSKASRRHARIVVGAEKAVLEDLGSKNGTHHRGHLLEGPCPLADGDELCVGDVVMTFRVTGGSATTETASRGGYNRAPRKRR